MTMTKERMDEITTKLMTAVTGNAPSKSEKMSGVVTEFIMRTEISPPDVLVSAGIVNNEAEALDFLTRISLGAVVYTQTGHTTPLEAAANMLKTGFAIGLLAGRKENAS